MRFEAREALEDPAVTRASLLEAGAFNAQLQAAFLGQREHWSYTHRIAGRYENIYLPLASIPALSELLYAAIALGKECFGGTLAFRSEAAEPEHNSFWFNLSQPGESTRAHCHDRRARLSGVYYLQVPEGSGRPWFRSESGEEVPVDVTAGELLFFAPLLTHGVEEHRGAGERLSFAFNLYELPVPPAQSHYF